MGDFNFSQHCDRFQTTESRPYRKIHLARFMVIIRHFHRISFLGLPLLSDHDRDTRHDHPLTPTMGSQREPDDEARQNTGEIGCRERLGGILRYCYRDEARELANRVVPVPKIAVRPRLRFTLIFR